MHLPALDQIVCANYLVLSQSPGEVRQAQALAPGALAVFLASPS
jgi:hypothetical protein